MRWRRRTVGAVVMSILVTGAVLGSGFDGGSVAGAAVSPALVGQVVQATNASRAANGLSALGWNSTLVSFAQSWAEHMAATQVLSHQDLMAVLNAGFYAAGENILVAPDGTTADQMEQVWMNSSGHRANILSPSFSTLGVGIAQSGDGRIWVSVVFADGAATGPPPSVVAPPSLSGASGELTPVVPTRLLDTRDGTGRAGNVAPLGPGQQLDLAVTNVAGIPATGVEAVVLNVTATGPTSGGWLAIWPTGAAQPLVSNLNFVPGQTVPNLVTVAVGTGGSVSIYNSSGSTHVVADVVAWYASTSGQPGGRFHATAPARVLDTRSGLGGTGPVAQGTALKLHVTGAGGVPSSGVTAVVMNVTVTEPTAAGFLTVFPDNASRPLASSLNFVAGQTVPNLVLVAVPPSGVVDFYNSSGSVHVIADVVGWYDTDRSSNAGRFVPITPVRLLDTRDTGQPVGPTGVVGLWIDGAAGLPAWGISAVVANVTVTQPTMPSYLTVYPDGNSPPLASNLNYLPGQTVPNLVAVKVGTNGRIAFFNLQGFTQVVVDASGYFLDATA
jgi:hypothetical protein